jgi:hypothetical protein
MTSRLLRLYLVRLFSLLAALLVLAPLAMTPVAAAGPTYTARDTFLLDATGRPLFLVGASYQGPADRAWKMWADDQFDATLIGQDFARARNAGLGVLRIFVQAPLAADLAAGRFQKLDRVLDLADKNGLGIILTLADYTDWDLAKLAKLDGAVAARYRGRATIVALDLKNEPHFGDLALSIYRQGETPPLQDPDLVASLGERITREEIPEYRASEVGQKVVPQRLDDEQAYVYVNVLRAYQQLLEDSSAWVKEHDNGNVVRYLRSPEAAAWAPLTDALNDSLALWLRPRLGAIRQADPDRLVTLAQVDTILATLPVNAWLDYRTYHRYPGASSAGVKAALTLWDDVRAAVPGRPIVLGELGISNDATDEATSASLELTLMRGILDHGGAGALKWMLNDVPNGANPRENSFGMFRADGTPKPVVDAVRTFAQTASRPAMLVGSQPAGGQAPALNCPAGSPPASGPAVASQGRVVVAGTDGEGVFLRRTPRLDDKLGAWSDGTRLAILGPDVLNNGLRWVPVRDPCGIAGWMLARYAAPAAP